MTGNRAAVFRRRAADHAAIARRYRRNADALLQQGERESAGELLYGAAKRCINAVANGRGHNPVRTTAKFNALQSIIADTTTAIDLHRGWHAAANLHTHGDQSHLTDDEFQAAWESTQAFIAAMLEIYNRDNLTGGGQL